MKEKWYKSDLAKAVWIVVVHLAVAALAVCLMLTSYMADYGVRLLDNEENSYFRSEEFRDTVLNMSANVVIGLKTEDELSEIQNGGPGRVLDLQEVYEGTPWTYSDQSGLVYSLEDLTAWAAETWKYGEGNNVVVAKTPKGDYQYFYYEDFKEKLNRQELQFEVDEEYMRMYGTTKEEILAQVQGYLERGQLTDGFLNYNHGVRFVTDKQGNVEFLDVWNFGVNTIHEVYTPVGYDSLLDVVNENENWNGRLREAYEALNNALYTISYTLDRKGQMEEYAADKTNLRYLYVDPDKKTVYSNEDSWRYYNYENALDDMTQSGCFAIFRSGESSFETDLNMSYPPHMSMWNDHIRSSCFTENYIFAVQVDQGLTVTDAFSVGKEEYERYAAIRMPVLQVVVLAILLLLTGLIWLTLVAGRNTKDEELHLNGFDRWFTEAAALLVSGFWLFMITFGVNNFTASYDEISRRLLFIAFLGLFSVFMFLIGYLSLVRRIKAKTLWSNSFTLWFLKKIAAVIRFMGRNTGTKVKTLVLGGAFMLFQFIVNGLIFGGNAVFLLILVLVDCLVLIYFMKKAEGCERIVDGLKRITDGELQHKISLEGIYEEQKTIADHINNIGDGLDAAVENSLKNERMKTELITNVSHDLKTPLTSIINYVDLLKRENFTDPKVCSYLDILESKAQRLKVLTEDVLEASKASTGNISLEMVELNFIEMVHQVIGEFEEKFQEHNLMLMVHFAEEHVVIRADGQRMWRVLENVFNNVVKYAMEGTRVYAEVNEVNGKVVFSLKNISAQPLNFSADELTERFIRGDVSRNTEGSGLGLSIAKSLTELQGGEFRLYLDGDLFKVMIAFEKK